MEARVEKMREASLTAVPSVSLERARLLTEAYEKYEGSVSIPALRALAFRHIMANKAIYIGAGELIVGERGEKPKATPTYPELCCHSLDDLHIINDRPTVFFTVDRETRDIQQEAIIPFWQERSLRYKIFAAMEEEWLAAYEAGIFTEFMEQRAPGHTVADGKIFKMGFLDFIKEIDLELANLAQGGDADSAAKMEQLQAMRICAEAIINFARRHGEKLRELAKEETEPDRREELAKMAAICEHVPAHAPRTFWEALQAYWFVHLGVITELNTWDSFCPGRLDQHLYPFYKKEIEAGSLTRERAKELLQAFWIKFNNQPAPPKVGITLMESNTYTDFANINIGGLKADGACGVNEVSYLLLEVVDEMQLTQPSSNIQLSKKNPDSFLKAAIGVIKKGRGQPSVFNADAVVSELLRQGKSIEDARLGGTSGCVETGAFGKESYILTGYLNLVKILEITLNNGIDPRTGKGLGLPLGGLADFADFDELFFAFERQLEHFIGIKIRGNEYIERLYAQEMPAPFLSIIIDDCIKKGRDYNAGGARYNSTYIQGVGIGTLTNSLAAIKYHVFDEGTFTGSQLMAGLAEDFQDNEKLHRLIINKSPHYGNDDDYADEIMARAFNSFFKLVDGRPNLKGGQYRINMLPTTSHVYFGSVIGATPDGRRARQPLSEGISPVQGTDIKGPTAVIKSASKMDHLKTGGTLLNMKFTPQLLADKAGIDALANLIRAYFRLDGHHVQFNVIDAATLKEAQKKPQEYRDLIVRVAGYSDYFGHLSKALQDEIIARTEHKTF